ncbi:MAG: methyl-accepting chemotaxis protein [Clostridiales bacterium]|nr:methyl-accepting chemotaxis protein [Clostridiales bacterium]
MKKLKRKISFIMSLIIIFGYFFQSSLIVFASNVSHGGGGGNREEGANNANDNKIERDWSKILDEFINDVGENAAFLAAQVGSLYNGDFVQYLENNDAYIHFWNRENISVDDDGNFTFSQDLVSAFKQALTEYEEETNGYYILSTPSVMQLDPTKFSDRNIYISLVNMINNHGIVLYDVFPSGSYKLKVIDFSPYISSNYSLCFKSTSSNPVDNPENFFEFNIYDSDWQRITLKGCCIWNSYYNNEIFTEIPTDEKYMSNSSYSNIYIRNIMYPVYPGALRSDIGYFSNSYSMPISKDGCRIRIFKSENAMKLYDAGKRAVYFTPDFYDKEPQEIVVKFDDLEKYLNTDYDKYFQEIRDTIASQGSNLSEADIENVTKGVLDKLNEINGSIGDVGDNVNQVGDQLKETNGILQSILAKLTSLDDKVAAILEGIDDRVYSTVVDMSGVESRLDDILLSLGDISGKIDDLTAEEINQKTDDLLNDMQLEFSDIGDIAKTKFPLSLPWDLGKAFDKISGSKTVEENSKPPEAVAMLLSDEPDTFVHTMSLYDDNGVAVYDSDAPPDDDYGGNAADNIGNNNNTDTNADNDDNNGISLHASVNTDGTQGGGYPVTNIGINDLRGTYEGNGSHTSAGGHEHGGGGASRYGAWLSDSGAPIFYMPVEFSQSMNIGGLLIIDLSGFEVLHSIGRLMFSIIFCINLVHLTFKAISAGKDLLEW